MRPNIQISLYPFAIFLLMACTMVSAKAQDYYKFPVTQSGIYKITSAEARQLGASSVEQLSIYGQKGMLPQKLDAADLELKEIPTWLDNDQFFVYLEGPHTLDLNDGTLQYKHHHYSDTAFYLIQAKSTSPKRINTATGTYPDGESGWLYQIYPYKKESQNLLSSGRKWYSNKLFSGGISSFNISVPPYDQGPIYYQTLLMAQSFSPSELSIRSGQTILTKTNIEAVPNSTYSIKGREGFSQGFTDYFDVGSVTSFNLEMSSANEGGVGFLDYFLLGLPWKSEQVKEGIYFPLTGQNIQFTTAPQSIAWDISDLYNPMILSLIDGSNTIPKGHKLLVFNPKNTKLIPTPQPAELSLRKNAGDARFIIIAPPSLMYQANRLADHKTNTGIKTLVVNSKKIYEAYNYGTRDVSAIRNFLADQYLKSGELKHVLLFGKGTFDYKNIIDGRPNLIPTYSSRSSLDPLTSFSSDDFFGFLELGQGEWEESNSGDTPLCIGVGRIPVINPQEAKHVVDKIIQYETLSQQQGDWKRKLLFVADDGDHNIHLRHSETHTLSLAENHPEFISEKLYLDNFEQLQEDSYQTAPLAKDFLTEKLNEGVLLVNYIGHGNESTLTAERLYQTSDLENWPETSNFPIFVTATCEFGRQDSPFLRCGAEELLIAEKKGAIALLTTGRPVFSSINFELNKAFISALFTQTDDQYLQLGDIFRITKNNSLNGPYNRNFSLIGDPSLRLPLPELKASVSVFKPEITTETDTLIAGSEALIKGNIIDPFTGAVVTNFDGQYQIDLYDRPLDAKTLGDEGPEGSYQEPNITLHRGTGTVKGGHFEAKVFIKPGINQNFEEGNIKIFASAPEKELEAFGSAPVLLGGTSEDGSVDQEGPIIKLYAEDSLKNIRTIPSTQMRLLARISDESGIQLSKIPAGQNIRLTINNEKTLILNSYYQSLNGDFVDGLIDIKVNGLSEGNNLLSLTAFDNFGNSSTQTLEVEVRGSQNLKILEHVSYPNPAHDISHFFIKHNRPDENIILHLTVYNLMGSEIFSLRDRLVKAGNEINDIEWIFLRDKTKIPAKGTYIYRLQLISETDGTSDQAIGKINIQ